MQSALEEERARALGLEARLHRVEAAAAQVELQVERQAAHFRVAAELASQDAAEASRFKAAAIDEVAVSIANPNPNPNPEPSPSPSPDPNQVADSIASVRAVQGRADRAEVEAREALRRCF